MINQTVARITRNDRQGIVNRWVERAFGARFLTRRGRAERVIEEAAETVQACDLTEDEAISIVRKVYAKPVGLLPQELGGLSIAMLSLAETTGYSLDQCEQDEIRRVLELPLDHFHQRLKAKIAEGIVIEGA